MLLNEALEVHEELNPVIWNEDGSIKPDVANTLNSIAEEFLDFVDMPLNVVDINIVGSNASYNYNDNSDIDLHIIVNSEVSYMDETILQLLYNSRKGSFNEKYDLSVSGIPVELYIEDVKSNNATNGRYSLIKDEWIQYPKPITYDIPDISQDVIAYQEKCCDMLDSDDSEAILSFLNDLYMMRKIGLAEEGEASIGNLIFKELRNMNLLSDLKDRYYQLRSEELSD